MWIITEVLAWLCFVTHDAIVCHFWSQHKGCREKFLKSIWCALMRKIARNGGKKRESSVGTVTIETNIATLFFFLVNECVKMPPTIKQLIYTRFSGSIEKPSDGFYRNHFGFRAFCCCCCCFCFVWIEFNEFLWLSNYNKKIIIDEWHYERCSSRRAV